MVFTLLLQNECTAAPTSGATSLTDKHLLKSYNNHESLTQKTYNDHKKTQTTPESHKTTTKRQKTNSKRHNKDTKGDFRDIKRL